MSNWWPIKAKLKADLTKPAEDITGMVSDTHKGFGKILYAAYGPWVAKRLGEAKRIEAQAERDAAEIKDGISKYDIAAKEMISLPEVSSIDALCAELESVNSALKAKRLAAAIMAAAIEMKQIPEEEVSDEPLNQTFFNHWRAEAELIDEDDLRQWWAHLLVEETKKPNTVSLRTLDVAKNLSKSEADLFITASKSIINDVMVNTRERCLIFGTYPELLTLQDAGLLGTESSTKTFTNTVFAPGIGYGVYILHKDCNVVLFFEKNKVSFSCSTLTVAGREIYKLCTKNLSMDELKKIAEEISQQNDDARVTIFPLAIDNGNPTVIWNAIWSNCPKNYPYGESK